MGAGQRLADLATQTLAAESLVGRTRAYFTNPEVWTKWAVIGLKILAIYIIGRIIIKVGRKAIERVMIARDKSRLRFDPRRTKTMGKLFENMIAYVVNFITVMMIFSALGIDLRPLLAGAGVVGLAIGFGAQSLVKDIITGFFIILEDQFGVGDVVQTGQYKGTVEAIGLRVTRIKSWTGEMFIIPNGNIQEVTNFSLNNALAVIDVSVSYEEDLERTQKVLKDILQSLHESDDNIVKEPEILGIQSLGNTSVTLRISAECKPNTQALVTREINARIKQALHEHNIEIPYPKVINFSRMEQKEGGS